MRYSLLWISVWFISKDLKAYGLDVRLISNEIGEPKILLAKNLKKVVKNLKKVGITWKKLEKNLKKVGKNLK